MVVVWRRKGSGLESGFFRRRGGSSGGGEMVGGGGITRPIPLLPLVSRLRPAESNNGFGGTYDADNAVDADYNTYWRSINVPSAASPQWVAVDISGLSTAQRSALVSLIRTDASTNDYWETNTAAVYVIPEDYTIQGNTAAGGGAAPTSGWVTLATVTGSFYTSRTYNLGDLHTYNWLRVSVTKSHGATANNDASLQWDLHDASLGMQDSFLALGDSIAAEGFRACMPGGGTWTNGIIAQQVQAVQASRFPLIMPGGVSGKTLNWALLNKETLLAPYVGHFVILSFGTNDAAGNVTATAWDADLGTMLDYLHGLGKVVILPQIPKRGDAADTYVQQYNTKIQARANGVDTLLGPNMYSPALTLRDGVHPTYTGTPSGYDDWQSRWATWLLNTLY